MAGAGCGGDDTGAQSGDGKTDGGMSSTGTATDGGGTQTMIPRRDAQISDVDDPIADCDPTNPACPSGEVCDLLFRRAAGEMQFSGQFGCVPVANERGLGAPCDPDPTSGEPYTAPGVTDIVFRESCGEGLVCAPNKDVRGAYSCQPLCGNSLPCEDPTALCLDGPVTGYCRQADGCDVEKQTGCRAGDACYLIPSDDITRLLSICVRQPSEPLADGTTSCGPTSCRAGSVCLGPARSPISAWNGTNVMCRRVCNGEMGTAPAVSDEDAGVPLGLCSETEVCQPYSASGLLLSDIPVAPFGQCEAP